MEATTQDWLAHALERPNRRRRVDLRRAARLPTPRAAAREAAELVAEECGRRGVGLVGLGDPAYPRLLRGTVDPPLVLFARGAPEAWAQPCVALVGSRAALPYSRAVARRMAGELAAAGVCIVSGLARGIDAEAHRGALEAGGRTVAVLGSGHARLYPRGHEELAEAIVRAGGAVLSEHPPRQGARPFLFPRRNRVVAGMSQAVLVIAAGERSGALITADWALGEGRPVLAVPGPVDRADADGANRLIQDGAPLVRSAEDVLAALELDGPPPAPPPDPPRGGAVGEVWELLGAGVCSSHELIARARAPVGKVLGALTRLELDGWVESFPGRYFCRRRRPGQNPD